MAKKKKTHRFFKRPKCSEFKSPGDEYVQGNPISITELAEKWKAKRPTLIRWSKKEGWVKKREKFQKELAERIRKDDLKRAAREKKLERDNLRDYSKGLVKGVYKALEGLIYGEDEKTKTKKVKAVTPAEIHKIMLTLEKAMEGIEKTCGFEFSPKDDEEKDTEFNINFNFGSNDKYRSKLD